jgi:hypothetical protein
MNNNIPVRKPLMTFILWYPCSELSRDTSRHHRKVVRVIAIKLICKKVLSFVCIMMIVLISTFIVRNPDRIGQGLGEIM